QARYRLWTNSRAQVTNYGASASGRYELTRGYFAGANATLARLDHRANPDGLEDGFNTPQWSCNVSLANERALGRLGFGVNYRWQSRFYWQSFLVNGDVPAYGTLDAQLTYAVPHPDLRIKLGATNLTNRYYRSFLGGPAIGGFYYLTLTGHVR
ncbi:MAG: TonB-dependent receptor, partial [Hymenobacteraceae bacterium]|nr:TonB-dependent receptor [Hymenobacteraceae bacterium]